MASRVERLRGVVGGSAAAAAAGGGAAIPPDAFPPELSRR